MSLIVQPEPAKTCIDEVEREFLRVGADECKCLKDTSQLSAFLRLGVRADSLLRGMLPLLENDTLDSYDALRRAYYETWLLQFEFRLRSSSGKVARWFQGQADAWRPDPQRLAAFIETLGRNRPPYGREYGELSELAHPTAQATENSCAVATKRWNISSVADQTEKAMNDLREDFTVQIIHEIWLVDVAHDDLIDLRLDSRNLAQCGSLFSGFLASRGKAGGADIDR